MIKSRLRNKKGFTLVEMLISIAIFAVIGGIVSIFLIQGLALYRNELDSNADEGNLRNGMERIVKTLHSTPSSGISVDTNVLTAGDQVFSFSSGSVLCNGKAFITGVSSFSVTMENNTVGISITTAKGRSLSTSFGLR